MLPAHARVATESTRDGRALSLAQTMAHATGLGPTAHLLSFELGAVTIYQPVVPRAHSLSFSSVP